MIYQTLISLQDLHENLNNPNLAILDCRIDFNDLEAEKKAYQESHIPGAIYVHMEEDLSGPIIPGKTSRHPFPDPDVFAATLSRWGIDENVQVVAYDNRGSGLAVRVWLMLRWLGHESVAVLDGSFNHWVEAGYPTKSGTESLTPRTFTPKINPDLFVPAEDLLAMRSGGEITLVDSRAPQRYRGEVEPFDPIAGHIPGALNAFWNDNLNEDGFFKSKEELRNRFENLLKDTTAEKVVFYCGSGVTAIHNILSFMHAGLGQSRLYPGSWSEWITDPNRPISTGDKP